MINPCYGVHSEILDDVALGLLFRDGDAGVFGDGLLGDGPPFLEFVFAHDLREGDFHFDDGGGVIRVGLEGLDDELGGVFRDELGDFLGLGLLADEQVIGGQQLHRGDAERRAHGVLFLVLEVDE